MFVVDTKEQALEIIQRTRKLFLEKKGNFSGEEEMWLGRSSSLLSGVQKVLQATDDPDEIDKILYSDLRLLDEVAGSDSVLRSYLLNLDGFTCSYIAAQKQHQKTLTFLQSFLLPARREVLRKTPII